MPVHIIFLLILFAGVILCDLLLAVLSLQKKTAGGHCLGVACLSAAFVTASYLISVFVKDYFLYSVLSSLYFMGIDVALLELAVFVRYFTLGKKAGKLGLGWLVLYFWALVDMVILAVNPFREIAIHYIYAEQPLIAHYSYEMKISYQMHLLLAYVLIALVLAYLVRKAMTSPSVYRRQYYYAILALLLVVVINAFYLWWPTPDNINMLDYSLLGYSLAAFLFYWSCFVYMPNGMMKQLRSVIFERIDRGILLFDYADELILENGKAREFFEGTAWRENPTLESLLQFLDAGISMETLMRKTDGKKYSFQCYPDGGEEQHAMLCDYSTLLSQKGEVLGRLFVLSDLSAEYDTLTGFYSWETYKKKTNGKTVTGTKTVAAAACDINDLTAINEKYGRSCGDQAIRILARKMHECFPEGTFFIRGREAILLAVCEGETEKSFNEILTRLEELVAQEMIGGGPLGIQTAIKCGEPSEKKNDVVRGAMETLGVRKLLDQNSRHSEVLYSLIQALQECDPDTEAHVRRTQKLGARLGRKIGLTEEEQSKLALLAILHDIGKIGIPLDILNKPGKLTEAEWSVLKTHVDKGYQIANSSEGLKGIAEMILYHHERWDGKGYPSGLSKESIPLLSRMISVVDAYDAMINDRAYRPAMPKEAACRELKRCAGTQFDPTLVAAFLEILREDGVDTETVVENAASPEENTEHPQWSAQLQESASAQIPRIHSMQFSCYVLSLDLKVIRTDDAFELLTGYAAQDVRQNSLTQKDLIFEEDWEEYYETASQGLAEASVVYLEHRIRRKDGSPVYVFCYGRKFYDSAERKERIEVTISDSAASYSVQSVVQIERGKASRRLERWENKFRRDSLTGLLNHEAFKNDVETRILAGDTQALMLMMDVDRFKEYNDTYGHRAGDEFLVLVAQTLMASLRKDDFACRMGGDEFAAILFFRGDTTRDQMKQRALQICDRINLTLTSGSLGGVALSMGGAFLDQDYTSFDRLYEAADQALYRAKKSGKGKLCF